MMKKILITLWVGAMVPTASFAEGSFFSNWVKQVFSGTLVEQVAAPATGEHLSGQINKVINPISQVQMQPQSYPQNGYTPQAGTLNYAQQQKINEDLVRCAYLGASIQENTKFSVESVEAQENAQRAGKLLAGLNCNPILTPYTNVIKQLEHALNACAEDENCGTISQPHASSGGLKK
jgi:hypothetical protein